MTTLTIAIFEDPTCPGDSIGIRSDGYWTASYDQDINRWEKYHWAFAWLPFAYTENVGNLIKVIPYEA